MKKMKKVGRDKQRSPTDCYRIMVLYAQSEHLHQIKEACAELGQEVVAVSTNKAAMAFLNTKDHVDVVVCEAFSENENVFDFLRKMKEDPQHKDVPVMLMASEPGEIGESVLVSVVQTAQILGAYKFLYMPKFDVRHLMREVQAVLPHEHQL